MDNHTISGFSITGISVRTTNENGQASKDIPALWNIFMNEKIIEKIPNKIDNTVYCVYTDYEKDHTRPYTTILGCKVENLEMIPEGMTGKMIRKASYKKFVAKGNIMQGMIYDEWIKIWNAGLDRSFTADFEVYGEKAQNPGNAEVDIFIAIQEDEKH